MSDNVPSKNVSLFRHNWLQNLIENYNISFRYNISLVCPLLSEYKVLKYEEADM